MKPKFKLQFVQEFSEAGRNEFLRLEKEFARLEQQEKDFPKGIRYVCYMGSLPVNTFIWESEFPTLEAAIKALTVIKLNDKHEDLFREQNRYFVKSYVNIFQRVCDG